MKQIALSFVCAAALFLAWEVPAMAGSLSLGQVVDGLDTKNQTKANAENNWKKFKHQEVSWSGTLHEVSMSGDEAKLYIADKSRPRYEGFNIYFVTKDTDKALKIKRGQTVRVTGELDDYHWHGRVVVIKLNNAHLK